MPAPLVHVEAADDEFDYELDWEECIDGTQPGGGVALTGTAQDAVLVGYVDFNKQRACARYFLGYSYADDAAPWLLHREPPARHPIWPNLYAHSISFSGLGLPDDAEFETGWRESPFEGSQQETLYYAPYSKVVATVRFRSFGRVRFLPDDYVTDYRDEYKRYVRFGAEPSVEALSADGLSQLTFREGVGSTQPVADETKFPAPIAELMAKAALTIQWLNLPHNYVSSDPDILVLDQILGFQNAVEEGTAGAYPTRLGTLNNSPFLGFRTGTLLLRAVKAEEVLFPVATADPFELAGGWNLTLVWEHFDPKKGIPHDPDGEPATNSPYFGHRLFPSRFGGWFYANRDTTQTELIPLTDHWKVFAHQGDTSAGNTLTTT